MRKTRKPRTLKRFHVKKKCYGQWLILDRARNDLEVADVKTDWSDAAAMKEALEAKYAKMV